MTAFKTYLTSGNRQRLKYLLAVASALLFILNILLDYHYTRFQNSRFYLSESLLFSGAYWSLFILLLPAFLSLSAKTPKLVFLPVLMLLTPAIHLLIYPGLVWLISALFFEHTFAWRQTFHFGISAYAIKSLLIYGFSLAVYLFVSRLSARNTAGDKVQKQEFISILTVSDVHNNKLVLPVKDILYFSAKPPYVSVHQASKKHLLTGTLRALENQLDAASFVRIHKSYLINLTAVTSYKSRQNGDYDVVLSDHTVLRLSRSYAAGFKSRISAHPRLTSE